MSSKYLVKYSLILLDCFSIFKNSPVLVIIKGIKRDSFHLPNSKNELSKIRNSVNRQAPLGDGEWQLLTAAELGLLSTLNQRGRSRKALEVGE